MTEVDTAVNDNENEFPLPQPVVDEVFKYAAREGSLTDQYYEYENEEWVLVDGQPDFKQDRREGAGDTPYIGDKAAAITEVPTFLGPLYAAKKSMGLFKAMLEKPLDKKAADAYERGVNTVAAEKAEEVQFKDDVTLPVYRVRGIVMTCANLHSLKEGMEAQQKQGKSVRVGETDLEDIRSMYSSTLEGGKNLLDAKGCPSTWAAHLDATILKLSEDHRKTKQGSVFTDQQLADVLGQHGGSPTYSASIDLSKKMQDAENIFTNAIDGPTLQKDALALAAVPKPSAPRGHAATKSQLALKSPAGISKPGNAGTKKRRTPNALPASATKPPVGGSDPTDQDVQMSEDFAADVDSSGDINMNDTGADIGTERSAQDGGSDLGASNDAQMGDSKNDQRTINDGVRDQQDTSGETVFPTDMAWYRSQWDEATPTMGQVLDKPRNALREAGEKLATMNTNIKTRAAYDQEQMALSGNPVAINVELEVPVVDFMRVMILCTDSLVASGKSNATEIEESPAKTARDLLLSRLERAGQPWHDSVDDLIECKAVAWKKHMAAGTEPEKDEYLWDDEFKRVVLESHEKAEQPLQADVFADAKNQKGKIGGFQVTGTKRDGTETYQVFVEKGTYNQGRTSFWHIHPASMYRDGLVEDYKNNKGTQIKSSNEAKDELMRLRQYKLEDVQISGIAVIPRTTGEGFSRMPTMFIRASVDDDGGPRFWSRSYMDKVWGQAATRNIRNLINDANIPVLTNDPTRPNLFFPQNASKRTCKLWGVEYTGPTETAKKGKNITGEKDGEREPNDGVYDSDGGFVVKDDTETPINPNSKEFLRADKLRKMEELRVRLAELERSVDNDE
jgi:hypothetical protein